MSSLYLLPDLVASLRGQVDVDLVGRDLLVEDRGQGRDVVEAAVPGAAILEVGRRRTIGRGDGRVARTDARGETLNLVAAERLDEAAHGLSLSLSAMAPLALGFGGLHMILGYVVWRRYGG